MYGKIDMLREEQGTRTKCNAGSSDRKLHVHLRFWNEVSNVLHYNLSIVIYYRCKTHLETFHSSQESQLLAHNFVSLLLCIFTSEVEKINTNINKYQLIKEGSSGCHIQHWARINWRTIVFQLGKQWSYIPATSTSL